MEKVYLPKDLLKELYFGRKLSLREISRELKIDLKTLLREFREAKIGRRTLRDAWKIRQAKRIQKARPMN